MMPAYDPSWMWAELGLDEEGVRHPPPLAHERVSRLVGHYLRVATVFVTEQRTGDERTLHVCFAFDALGADLPHLVHHSIPIKEDPDGRTILRRFMERGHWRRRSRAARDWADQRLRWIQPYWKGPDMAAIIERTYKLKP